MATSFIFGYSQPTAFMVRCLASRGNLGHLRLVKAAPSRCEQMTKQEAERFFAACEAPFQPEINVFAHLPEVAQWFRK